MRERLSYWWRVLRLGADQVNVVAGWVGTIFLAIGVIAGFTVDAAVHQSHWLIAVIVLSILVFVTAEGGYRVWHKSDEERKKAQAERDAARRDRSVAAASRLVDLIAGLDGQVAIWEAGNQNSVTSGLTDAYNQFAQKEVAASADLTDEDLRSRVQVHSDLASVCLTAVRNAPECRPQVVRLLRDHARSVVRALKAHQQGAQLPAYDPPPLEKPINPTNLFAWQPVP
jgi:hypothetical protein